MPCGIYVLVAFCGIRAVSLYMDAGISWIVSETITLEMVRLSQQVLAVADVGILISDSGASSMAVAAVMVPVSWLFTYPNACIPERVLLRCTGVSFQAISCRVSYITGSGCGNRSLPGRIGFDWHENSGTDARVRISIVCV